MRRAPVDEAAAYDFISNFRYGDISLTPFQVRQEFESLLDVVKRLEPARVLEIGTARGGTLFLFTRVAAANARLVSVDMPGGRFGGGYPRSYGRLYRASARDDQTVDLIRADSHSPATRAAVVKKLGSSVDFLFIDGDHTYDGVRQDFEMYEPLVRRGGVIAFHDIVEGPPDDVGGVPQFWSEVRERHEAEEFIQDRQQGGLGIGVIRKP